MYVAASAADQRPHMTDTTTVEVMIGLGAGMTVFGLAAGIGGVLYERAEEPTLSRVWVAPVVGGGHVGGSVGGAF